MMRGKTIVGLLFSQSDKSTLRCSCHEFGCDLLNKKQKKKRESEACFILLGLCTYRYLGENELFTLPDGIFDNLTSLTGL